MNEELKYKIWQIVTTVFIAVGIAVAMGSDQPRVAIVVLATGLLLRWMLKARYKAVILVDERTKRIGERAGSTTFWIFLVATALTMVAQLILDSVSIRIPQLKEMMEPLSYIALGIMAVYAVLVRYYSRKM